MYYRLLSNLSFQAGNIVKKRNQNVNLITGALIDESKLRVLPWPLTVKPPREKSLKMSDFYRGNSLMSNRFIALLRNVGVDNLQVFPAVITNTKTQETRDGYSVINIIGSVFCADQERSESTPLASKKFFMNLVIDPSKVQNLPIFRLAESPIEILVNERVAKVIEEANLIDVKLEPVESA